MFWVVGITAAIVTVVLARKKRTNADERRRQWQLVTLRCQAMKDHWPNAQVNISPDSSAMLATTLDDVARTPATVQLRRVHNFSGDRGWTDAAMNRWNCRVIVGKRDPRHVGQLRNDAADELLNRDRDPKSAAVLERWLSAHPTGWLLDYEPSGLQHSLRVRCFLREDDDVVTVFQGLLELWNALAADTSAGR